MPELYTEIMLAPLDGIDVERLNRIIDNLNYESISTWKFINVFEPLVNFKNVATPELRLEASKTKLREAVGILAKMIPFDAFGAPGTEPVAILIGYGDLDSQVVEPADAIALVRNCPPLNAALYNQPVTVTLG